MSLNTADRGMLEKIIDRELNDVAKMIKMFRIPEIKSQMHIVREDDYVLGLAMGHIMGKFEAYYSSFHYPNSITPEELNEASNITFRRFKEIKEIIFKSG